MGITPSPTPGKKDLQMAARLSQINGTQFDRPYLQAMAKDHQADVSLFQREASRTHDPLPRAREPNIARAFIFGPSRATGPAFSGIRTAMETSTVFYRPLLPVGRLS